MRKWQWKWVSITVILSVQKKKQYSFFAEYFQRAANKFLVLNKKSQLIFRCGDKFGSVLFPLRSPNDPGNATLVSISISQFFTWKQF